MAMPIGGGGGKPPRRPDKHDGANKGKRVFAWAKKKLSANKAPKFHKKLAAHIADANKMKAADPAAAQNIQPPNDPQPNDVQPEQKGPDSPDVASQPWLSKPFQEWPAWVQDYYVALSDDQQQSLLLDPERMMRLWNDPEETHRLIWAMTKSPPKHC